MAVLFVVMSVIHKLNIKADLTGQWVLHNPSCFKSNSLNNVLIKASNTWCLRILTSSWVINNSSNSDQHSME